MDQVQASTFGLLVLGITQVPDSLQKLDLVKRLLKYAGAFLELDLSLPFRIRGMRPISQTAHRLSQIPHPFLLTAATLLQIMVALWTGKQAAESGLEVAFRVPTLAPFNPILFSLLLESQLFWAVFLGGFQDWNCRDFDDAFVFLHSFL